MLRRKWFKGTSVANELIRVGGMDTSDIFGLLLGFGGGAYGGYEAYTSSKVRSDWGNVKATWASLDANIAQWFMEVNAIITKFNNAFSGAVPLDVADVDREEAIASALEKIINEQFVIIYKDLDATIADVHRSLWYQIDAWGKSFAGRIGADAVLAAKALITGGMFIGGGFIVTKLVTGLKNRYNDSKFPFGLSLTMADGTVITGNTTQELELSVQRYYATTYVLNDAALATAMPGVVAQFNQLPSWVRNELANEAGITEFYQSPASVWATEFRHLPAWAWGLLAAIVVIGIAIDVALAPAILGSLEGMQTGMAPALVLAPA